MTQHANDLKQQIERILHWEPSSHWRLRDFEHLSELIYTYTQQHVPGCELETFWQSSAFPSLPVLNALARFADYGGWNDFCARNFYGVVKTDDEIAALHAPILEIPIRWVVVICWLSLIVSVAIGVLLVWK